MRRAKVVVGAAMAMWSGVTLGATPDLDWLTGRWCAARAGQLIEETWLAPVGGALIGMSRTTRGEAMQSFEFMRITRDGAHTAMHVLPNGEAATVFPMVASGPGWVRFANAAHDFPNTIEYRSQGERLHAWIAGPDQEGKPMRIAFDYTRCAP